MPSKKKEAASPKEEPVVDVPPVLKTGGEVDGIVMALIEALHDRDAGTRTAIHDAIRALGRTRYELVLSSIENFLLRHQRLPLPHRVALLNVMETVVVDVIDKLSPELAHRICRLGVGEIVCRQEIVPEWQSAASSLVVALGTLYGKVVMDELMANFLAGELPHYYIVKTLGEFAANNVYASVPHLEMVFSRVLPMLGMIKMENLKWVFATMMSKLCDAIITYVANIDQAPVKTITMATYSVQIYSAFEVLFNVWINSKEGKLRVAVCECVGLMCHIVEQDRLNELIPKVVPGFLALYRKHPSETLAITMGLGAVLAAAVKDCEQTLAPHVDQICQTLYPLVAVTPNFDDPVGVKSYNEILRAFESICVRFSDKLMSFVFLKLEDPSEASRVGTLAVLRHLLNSSSQQLADKRELVVTGLRPLLDSKSTKVRSALAQVVIALAHHDYLSLTGGAILVQFVVDQCAIVVDPRGTPKKGKGADDGVTEQQLRSMCDNVLHLATTTIPSMQSVLWPHLLEFIVPIQYTEACSTVCKSLAALTETLRDDDDEIYDLDFDVQVNIPRPQEIVARLIVLLGHPLYRSRGMNILAFFEGMSPNLHDDIVDLWDEVIPRLSGYLAKHAAKPDDWNQQAWEDLVLKLLSRTLDAVDDEEWVFQLGRFLGRQYELYPGQPDMKNILSKCLGVVLRKSTNRAFIAEHLATIFANVNHDSQVEREGCARAFGFAASSHLDQVIEKLTDISKTQMVRKSTGFMGLMKDKSEVDVARIKASMMLCYGYVTLYAPPALIQSRVEVNILSTINPHFANVRDTAVKENLIRSVDLIGKSLHPSHLKTDKFILHRRSDLLAHMQNYMRAEPRERIVSDVRSLAMDACTTLLTLKPKLPDEELYELVDIATQSVFELAEPSPEDEALAETTDRALSSLDNLLATIIAKDTTADCLQALLKHIGRWMTAAVGHQRARMVACYRALLEAYHGVLVQQARAGEDRGSIDGFGKFVADLVPRCTDPVYEVRKDALGCIQWILRIQICYRGGGDAKDKLVEAISKLEVRAEKTEPTQQFAVVNDLSKVLANKVHADDLLAFVYPLLDGLLDDETSSSSGVCVVLNGVVRIRGEELAGEIDGLIDALRDRMQSIEHERTSTGVLRAVRTLSAHHLVKVVTKLQQFDLPYEKFAVDSWHSLGGDDKQAPLIVDRLLDNLRTARPYDEEGKKRLPALAAMKATCALKELISVEEAEDLIEDNYSKILCAILVRIGCTADVKSQGGLNPSADAVEALRTFVERSKSDFLEAALSEDGGWETLGDHDTYTEGLRCVAAAICKNRPDEVPALVEEFEPVLKQVYDAQRAVAAAIFAEFINERCAGSLKLITRLKNALLTKLVDQSYHVRMLVIRGLGNVASIPDEHMKKHSTTVLSAMMTGMDDRDDPQDLITLEAMRGLAKVLAKVDEDNVRQILINISLRIRPCFEKELGSVRAAAIRLFGNLSRFGDGPSKEPFAEQIHANLISILLHLNDEEEEVRDACRGALLELGPLLESPETAALFEQCLAPDASLHFESFLNDFAKLLVKAFDEKVNFYIMNCVNFFKSEWGQIKANAAILVGFLLGGLPKAKRKMVPKEHVCSELIRLLRDPESQVRVKAAESMSLLSKY